MSKDAALGFRILKLKDELKVSTHKDFEDDKNTREYTSAELSKARKLRCYHKNKHKYNQTKRAAARSISGRYKDAKRLALSREAEWEFTQDEWERVWKDAGFVLLPGTQSAQNPRGDVVPAFALRGCHRYKNTCMQRIDPTKAWSVQNVKIMYRGQALEASSPWYAKTRT